MIVHSLDPITLVGGSTLDRNDLNKSLSIAPIVVAADGGVRHLETADPFPSAVIGDFDSLPMEARETYADCLHHVAEQDTTDFEKVLQRVDGPLFLALGFLGGRIDHSFSTLNVIARYSDKRVILIGAEDIVALIPEKLTLVLPVETPIALLPMAPARAWTKGLRWNMDGDDLAPDGMVSSSNKVAEEVVELKVQGPVLLTVPKSHLDGLTAVFRGQ